MPPRKSDIAETGKKQLSMLAFLKKPKPNDNFAMPTAAPRKSMGAMSVASAMPTDGNGAPPPTPASPAPASTAKKLVEDETKFQIDTNLADKKPAFNLGAQPTPATNVAVAVAEKLSQVNVGGGTKRKMDEDSDDDEMPVQPKRKRRNSAVVESDEEMMDVEEKTFFWIIYLNYSSKCKLPKRYRKKKYSNTSIFGFTFWFFE